MLSVSHGECGETPWEILLQLASLVVCLVEGLLGMHEGHPTKQIVLQGYRNVTKDSTQHYCKHQSSQLHLLLLEYPHRPLQQLLAVGMLSCSKDKRLGWDGGDKSERTAKPLPEHAVPIAFTVRRQGLGPLVDTALLVLEVLAYFSVGRKVRSVFSILVWPSEICVTGYNFPVFFYRERYWVDLLYSVYKLQIMKCF